MNRTQTNIREIEAALGRARSNVPKLLAAAGVNRSTWTRWRAGETEPTMAKWRAVTDAAYMLTLVRF